MKADIAIKYDENFVNLSLNVTMCITTAHCAKAIFKTKLDHSYFEVI